MFAIDNRRSIREKVIPFVDKYMLVTAKEKEYNLFTQVVRSLENREHLTKEGLVRIVKLAYGIKGKGKQRKRLLSQVIDEILRDCTPDPG